MHKQKLGNRHRNQSQIGGLYPAVLLLSLVCLGCPAGSCEASDIDALTKKLAAASIADQVVFMCTLEFPAFVTETAGPRGTTRNYLDHIREELLSSIPPEEARRIVIGAANITRETGRSQARQFSPNYPDAPAAGLRKWCDTEGRAIVKDFMANHDKNHEKFLSEVAKEKLPAT